MFLIFTLGREDVFSVGDWALETPALDCTVWDANDRKAIEELSLNWAPFRSYASLALWRFLDNKPTV